MKQIITQRKNTHHFKIISRAKVAGLKLTGNQIKSLRNHQISIDQSYVIPYQGELFLQKAVISPYQYANQWSRKNSRSDSHKLLMKRLEINHLIKEMRTKHYSLIPLQVFINPKGWAKVEIALIQTLKKYQKKAELRERDIKKKLQRKDYS